MNCCLAAQKKGNYYWRDPQNCRLFFDAFAQSRGFDPLNPDNWYSLKANDFRDTSVAHPTY